MTQENKEFLNDKGTKNEFSNKKKLQLLAVFRRKIFCLLNFIQQQCLIFQFYN